MVWKKIMSKVKEKKNKKRQTKYLEDRNTVKEQLEKYVQELPESLNMPLLCELEPYGIEEDNLIGDILFGEKNIIWVDTLIITEVWFPEVKNNSILKKKRRKQWEQLQLKILHMDMMRREHGMDLQSK